LMRTAAEFRAILRGTLDIFGPIFWLKKIFTFGFNGPEVFVPQSADDEKIFGLDWDHDFFQLVSRDILKGQLRGV
jgi:hypothetical protein